MFHFSVLISCGQCYPYFCSFNLRITRAFHFISWFAISFVRIWWLLFKIFVFRQMSVVNRNMVYYSIITFSNFIVYPKCISLKVLAVWFKWSLIILFNYSTGPRIFEKYARPQVSGIESSSWLRICFSQRWVYNKILPS